MNTRANNESGTSDLVINVYLTDGSVESFSAGEVAAAQKIWDRVTPGHLFSQPRLVLAGAYSKSVYVTAQILRVDFVQAVYDRWEFPGGYADIVELSESEFRKHARLDQPELMPRREECTPVGDMLVSFLKLNMSGGKPIYLMAEFPVKLPAENQSFMQFLLSKHGFPLRLAGGGYAVVNLANLVGYTVYPGVAEIPVDAWLVEPRSR